MKNEMEDKLPNKFIGSFITLVGTGIILRFFSSLVDRVFFSNSEFKIVAGWFLKVKAPDNS